MNLTKRQKFLLSLISSIFLSFFFEVYVMAVETSLNINDFISLFSFKESILFFIILFIFFNIIYDKTLRFKVFDFIYKYRYFLSFGILVVCVVFQIHGSSINELNLFNFNHKPLLGISRYIRSDEYIVNTLLAFSQYCNGFGYFSDIIRATPTDMFIIYGQAVLDIAVIFRPFNMGYLFLSPAGGLSFFWISRLIVLFLISFEMGMLLTNRNKTLALTYALLITLSPVVQWWFAINGLVEQLIFGQLLVLLVNFYMNTNNYGKRILYALLGVISAGSFIIVFYPSWQIPFSYVFLLLIIWIFLKNKSNFSYNKKDFFIISLSLLIFILIMLHILSNSFETIKIILNTAYPGGEVFNGQGEWEYFFNYLASIFLPLTDINLPINAVEHSVFIDFFPIPIILSLIVLFQKTKDKLLFCLLALYFVYVIFYFVQLPDFIILVSLRSHIKTSRIFTVICFISVLMLIRALASLKEINNKKLIVFLSILLSCTVVYMSSLYFESYYLNWMIICLVILYSITFVSIFMSYSDKGKTAFLICVIFISFMAGALVNPIDSGCDVVYENDFIHDVKHIVQQDSDAVWLSQQIPINYLTIVGAKTINSINVYPNLDLWHNLDTNNESEDVYNRYAHIFVEFKNDSHTSFVLLNPDVFVVEMNVNDLEKLNVSYIATDKNLEEFNNENITFDKISENGIYKIFSVNYA